MGSILDWLNYKKEAIDANNKMALAQKQQAIDTNQQQFSNQIAGFQNQRAQQQLGMDQDQAHRQAQMQDMQLQQQKRQMGIEDQSRQQATEGAGAFAGYFKGLPDNDQSPVQGAMPDGKNMQSSGMPNVSTVPGSQRPEMQPLSIQSVAQSIYKNNPNISPEGFISALERFQPVFDQQSKLQLAQLRAQHMGGGGGIENALYQDALKKGMTPEQAAEVASKYKRAGADEAGSVQKAKEEAKLGVKTEAAEPKARQTMERMSSNADDAKAAVDMALKQSSDWTTGFAGNVGKHIPGTPAFDLAANLDRLQSRLGLDTLQEIKDSSPTGSALGRVTNYEMGILVKAKENLDQAQSRPQFEAALKDLKIKLDNSKKHVKDAYEETYSNKKQASEPSTSQEAVDYTEYFK